LLTWSIGIHTLLLTYRGIQLTGRSIRVTAAVAQQLTATHTVVDFLQPPPAVSVASDPDKRLMGD